MVLHFNENRWKTMGVWVSSLSPPSKGTFSSPFLVQRSLGRFCFLEVCLCVCVFWLVGFLEVFVCKSGFICRDGSSGGTSLSVLFITYSILLSTHQPYHHTVYTTYTHTHTHIYIYIYIYKEVTYNVRHSTARTL